MNITRQSFPVTGKPLFSILIPSWNNLPFLKLCVESIRKNSRFEHQIIIHINEGHDGTLEWVQQQQLAYTHSTENIGVCYALNAAAALAVTDYIAYMNDDMYVCPDWDKYLYDEIQACQTEYFFFSSTLIEPHKTRCHCMIAPANYGTSPAHFDEARLLKEYKSFQFHDWNGASWPPNVVHRNIWHLVGGYSIEFSPGMYSDPDFSMKLWQAGVRLFKGISASRVYHFMSKSTGKLPQEANKDGKKEFLDKWQMTARTFYYHFLSIGKPFEGERSEPKDSLHYTAKKIGNSLKRRLS
ncbi:glycosyltransferase family 2 protein [Microbacter margulisiae]|uniref:Glycosyltransferase involved in cell wall biosynthesis n=1 Tax=Microbacter margulisiae TaxID=1350067 RepID=A0A7W5DT02_9PORP|nr:glycosyltransferase [Microbacter margulisiae]MBB3187693.1 glycosyltransferase involved in cell wall biosynthesis [Microbacter margulisiae]